MAEIRWWGAPHKVEDKVPLLANLDSPFDEEPKVFGNADKMTIRVRGVMIEEDYEFSPGVKTDLMIVSATQRGKSRQCF